MSFRSAGREAWRILRQYALAFLVLLALVLLLARDTPTLWLVLTPFVLCLALILFWGLGPAARSRGRRDGPAGGTSRRPTLQAVVFRVVLIAMIAFFGLVVAAQRWGEQQAKDALEYSDIRGADYAMAQLDRGYRDQPVRVGDPSGAHPDAPGVPESGFGPEPFTGLWIDYPAYQRIREVIRRVATNGDIRGQGEYVLADVDMWPAKVMLPPSLLSEWRDGDVEKHPISIPGLAPYRYIQEPDQPSLAYIKEHGWWIGSGVEDADVEVQGPIPYHYAIFRTGPTTVYYVSSRDTASDSTPRGAPERWLQALYIFLLMAPLAGLTAWYLTRRLVDPVERVAAASGSLASGEWPEEVPIAGPAELASLAESFNEMAGRLEEAEKAEQQFLMSVSHELKTPMTAIEGYAELLTDGSVPPEVAAEALAGESQRLQRLIGDLIELGKMRQPTFGVRTGVVSAARVADEVARRHEAKARGYGVHLTVDVGDSAGESDEVMADEDRLVQVVSNLVENALRCTPEGGTVTIAARGGELRVSDTGLGLTIDDLPHAFERFYLYERCGKDRPVGTGLGLAIVKELVDAMGGTVDVTSEPDVGTTFVVKLPTPDAGHAS